jgi:putative salt-induced outer membrane protein
MKTAFGALIRLAGTCLLVGSAAAHDEPGEEPAEGWSGSVAGGYVAVRGNTESETENLKVEVLYDKDRWHHSLLGTAIGASQDVEVVNNGVTSTVNQTSAEAYKVQAKTKYDLGERFYAFGLAEYNKDRFSSYDYQIFEAAGVGWRVFHTDTQELNLEAGPGLTQSKLESGEEQNEAVARVGGDYHWHISENAVFSEKASSSIGSDNTYIESLTELKAGIVGSLSLVLGYLWKHNTEVDPGTDKSDTLTSVSLEYKF